MPRFVVTNTEKVPTEHSDKKVENKEEHLKSSIMTYAEFSAQKEKEMTPEKRLLSFNDNQEGHNK